MTRHAKPRAGRVRRSVLTAGLVAGAVIVPTGVAEAYWRTAGTGTGSATAGTITNLTGSTTVSTTLVPGGKANLVVTVTNPNTVAVTLTGLTAGAVTLVAGTANGAGCTGATHAVTATIGSVPSPVIAANGQASFTLTNAVSMGQSHTDCQNATFSVPLTLTGKTS